MTNELNNSKLDEKIKQSLSTYEAPYDAADWQKMERMLDATPKPTAFKWAYAIISFIGFVLLLGGYFIYNQSHSSKPTEEIEITVPQPPVIKTPVVMDTIHPVHKMPPVVSEPVRLSPRTIDTTFVKPAETEVVKTEKKLKKETIPTEKIKNKKTRNLDSLSTTERDTPSEKRKKNSKTRNEPVHKGIDSIGEVGGKTKEQEIRKSEQPEKTDYPVGWNKFMLQNVNPDSIRKHREMKKDSL